MITEDRPLSRPPRPTPAGGFVREYHGGRPEGDRSLRTCSVICNYRLARLRSRRLLKAAAAPPISAIVKVAGSGTGSNWYSVRR